MRCDFRSNTLAIINYRLVLLAYHEFVLTFHLSVGQTQRHQRKLTPYAFQKEEPCQFGQFYD